MRRIIILLAGLICLITNCRQDATAINHFFEILNTVPANGAAEVSKATPLILEFSSEVDPAILVQYLEVFDRTHNERFPLNAFGGFPPLFVHGVANKITLYPSRFKRNSEIEVTVQAGVKSNDGGLLREDYSYSFHTKDDLIPLYVSFFYPEPGQGVPVWGAEVAFEFSDPVNLENVWVTVLPDSPDYQIYWIVEETDHLNSTGLAKLSGNSNYGIVWQDSLISDTAYTITFSGEITDYEGDQLGRDSVITLPVTP